MNNRPFIWRCLIVWLAGCLLGGALLYAEQIRRQYWRLDRDFSTLFSGINAALTQNESVIPLLNGDESLSELQKKFPQIRLLETTQHRALDAPRVEPVSAFRYWLYNPYRQIRVMIDLEPYFSPVSCFTRLYLRLEPDEKPVKIDTYWRWQRTFPQHFQPFALEAEARPAWLQVPVLPFVVMAAGWALLVAASGLFVWQRRQQRNAVQRADYYQHARLNTLGEITAGIVHEINQPLTAVQTWIQGAERQLNNQQPDAAMQALSAARVQTQRISDLLTRFRAHVVQEPVTLTAVDLAQCWQRVGNLLEHERTVEHIVITSSFAADARMVLADKLWLEQVLHNLLSNAIQAQQEQQNRWVHIYSHAVGDTVEVVIADGGPGFTPEALERALMPFYSGKAGGTGLGMTLTESLMLRMNGSITLHNAPSGGAEICLTLAKGGTTSHG
ncbi:two-component sensor protein [Trabulsiella guamensis ATCC 49490]|uniref:histidine kinase n=1 Tax=Trabulsiella guamensis ATCC 49490 TaxID=1005994 RepID=A0A085AM41_9ENTR|nr:HAMP domain-containing sensor histidine kinase [Trabulsiella guamensis]KFC11286.1 two-component sensor protein [Trabulsiella guamensis ATCC 49490]